MRYYNFTTEKNTYRCRIDAEAACELEKELGENPAISMLKNAADGVPKLGPCMKVFHRSLQRYQHGISYEEAMQIYDEYIDADHSLYDFVGEVLEILHESGLLRKPSEEAEQQGGQEKN